MSNTLLMIFTKNPERGKVKTRLAATVGDAKALEIYKTLLHHTQKVTSLLKSDKAVFYADKVEQHDLWSEGIYRKELQYGESLGMRMEHAFKQSFDKGYEKVLIIGSDCLDLTTNVLEEAIEKLNGHDVVIGPSEDGGYYLLGMNRHHPELFTNKKWSTDTVFMDTLEDFITLGLTYFTLPTLSDIDTENDWNKALKKHTHVHLS